MPSTKPGAVRSGVGDVDSDEKGSGARFNEGKTQMEYVPARVLLNFYRTYRQDDSTYALQVLLKLADFEEGEDRAAAEILGQIPSDLLWKETCAQFHFGAQKYKAWNWAKGMSWSVPIACIKRHCIALLDGEEKDPESGAHHLGAVGCNAVMLMHYVDHFKEGDDRPPRDLFND